MIRVSLFGLLVIAVGSLAPAADAKKAAKVTYDEHVLPILKDKCITCHGQDKQSGGLAVHTFQNLMEGGGSGAVVKPGDPDGSRLFLLVSHKQQPKMPPKSPMMPKETLETIRAWIAAGALENAGSKAKIVNKPKVDIGLSAAAKGKPAGPPPMPTKPLSLEPVVRGARANALTAVASSPWAPLVAVAAPRQVLLYHSDTLELLGVLPFEEGMPHVLKFSRNGSLLLAGGGRGGKSGKVVVWSVATGERIIAVGDETDIVLAADISADQTQIALGGPSKMIRVYSTKDGSLLREIKKHTDWVYAMEYSPDGVLLATADRNGGLFVWEAYTGREYFSLRGHTAAVTAVSWRADANVLASASEDTTIRLWEMENGGQIRSWGAHGGGVQWVHYARDGRIVSCGRDNVCKLWDGNGGQQRAFDAFPDVATRVTFSHDGGRVIGGDWSGQIRVWTTADGKLAGNLASNPATVAERLDAATKDLATRQTAAQQTAAAAAASKVAADKAAQELAAAQKAVPDTAAAAKAAADAATKAKQAVDKAAADLTAAQAQVTAKDAAAKTAAQAAAQAKGAADNAKNNKDLAAAATKAQEAATKAAAELAAAQKAATDLTAAAKTANEQLTQAQQAATATQQAAVAAPKAADAKASTHKAAVAKAAADKVAADQAAAAMAAVQAQVEKLKAAQGQVKTVQK